MQIHQNNEIYPGIPYFNRSQDLELSIDSKLFINSSFITKNYYQFSSLLCSLVSKYESSRSNLNLTAIKDFVRYRHSYIENHDNLTYEESHYLNSLKTHVHKLHLHLNNLIDKHPVTYAVDLILEKIKSGVKVVDLHSTVSLNDCHVSLDPNGLISFHLMRNKMKVIVCTDESLLKISDTNNLIIIIFASIKPITLNSIKNCTNIYDVYIQEDSKNFLHLPTHNPLQSAAHLFFKFHTRLQKSNFKLADFVEFEVNSLYTEFYDLNTHEFLWKIDQGVFEKLKDLKRKVEKINNLVSSNLNQNFLEMQNCANYLKTAYGTLKFYANLDKKIDFSLGKIKRNSTLYMKSGAGGDYKDLIFSEENFSSILSISLECLFYGDRLSNIVCENRVGKGRSDIEITINKNTVSFIESKVIKLGEDSSKKISEGVDQLFSRYSENYVINGDPSLRLYLVLFSYDKDMNNLAHKISSELIIYSERNNLTINLIEEKENVLRFSYLHKTTHFADKLRFIDIIVCNLELGSRKKIHDRMRGTTYSLNHPR